MYREANPAKLRESLKKWERENPEKVRETKKKYVNLHPEKRRETERKYYKTHPEAARERGRRYRKRNPVANTTVMTKYKRSHRVCEWSYCDSTSVQVHHILPQFKYRDYIDGNYHGRIGNNFICYCPFHHFAYHCVYSTKRNNKKHKVVLPRLWWNVEQWADKNKISIEDLEIKLAQMYTQK